MAMNYEKRILYNERNQIIGIAIYIDGECVRRFGYTRHERKECDYYLGHLRHQYGARKKKP